MTTDPTHQGSIFDRYHRVNIQPVLTTRSSNASPFVIEVTPDRCGA
jgi:hypothetical protein